jgi:hypothetical protein
MRIHALLALTVLGCLSYATVVPAQGAPDDSKDPASRDSAVRDAMPVVAAARKAAKGDAETCKALKAARASLEPFASATRAAHWAESGDKSVAFANTWNSLLTLSEFHGVPSKPEYVLDRHEVIWKRYLLGLPTGNAWSWTYNTNPKDNDQLHMFVTQKRPNGEKLRYIKVWTYKWDTVYSGVGGENSKGLAKMMHEVDRDSTAKSGRKVSAAVTAKRLSAEFDRVYYYFVEGLDVDEEKRLRRDNYYMKGKNLTFNFEVITYLDPMQGDDEVTKWETGETDPEIKAVLESLVSNPNYKAGK